MRNSQSTFWFLTAIAAALLCCFLIPSGMLTEEARASYYQEDEEDWEEEVLRIVPDVTALKPAAVLASAALTDVLNTDIMPLDTDLFTPGSTPIEENFTEAGYRDETIIVDLETRRMYDSNVYIAYIQIASPSQLRTAIAGSKISSEQTAQTTTICSNYNGIVGINGDYYTKSKAGFIVRQGICYREKTSKNMDLLLIDELGDLHIIKRGHDTQKQSVAAFCSKHTIVNGFFFGPGLVIDSEVQDDFENYQFDPNGKNPRAAIAQICPLTYMLVVVNGRDESGNSAQGIEPSAGVTLYDFAKLMKELGSVQAYNLDGGNSASLCYHGELFNVKPQKERDVTDIIYFASAMGE